MKRITKLIITTILVIFSVLIFLAIFHIMIQGHGMAPPPKYFTAEVYRYDNDIIAFEITDVHYPDKTLGIFEKKISFEYKHIDERINGSTITLPYDSNNSTAFELCKDATNDTLISAWDADDDGIISKGDVFLYYPFKANNSSEMYVRYDEIVFLHIDITGVFIAEESIAFDGEHYLAILSEIRGY